MATAQIEVFKRLNLQMQMTDAVTLIQQTAKLNEAQNILRYAAENPALFDYAVVGTALSTAQAGNGASTNVLDSANYGLPAGALFRVTAVIGATPTCTYALQGSPDNSNWSALTYSDSATPATFVATTFVMTTAVTKILYVKSAQAGVRYLRVFYSANTNITNTVDVLVF